MKCRTVGVLVALLSSAAACGSNETFSGASDAVVVTDTVDTVPTTVSTVVVESVPDTTLPEPTSPETTTNLAALDERLTRTPIGVTPQCSETSCVSVAVTLAGEVVSYDSSTRVLTFVDSGRTVVIDPSVVGLWYLVLMGPDEVAYLTSFPDGVRGEALDLVAVPTSGAKVGQDVGRVGGLDATGDSSLIATANGVMQVGCCGCCQVGARDRLPRGDTPLTMAWVTPTGKSSGVVLADVHLEYPGDESTVVVRTDPDGTEQHWMVLGRLAGRDMPPVVATSDGGALLWMYDPYLTADGPAVVYDLRPDGSVDTFMMGTYQYAVALHSSRFIVVFDGAYIRLTLP